MRYSTTRPPAPTEAHGCERLAQSCYPVMRYPGVEPTITWSRVRRLSTLQWCWWDGRTYGVTLPSTRPGAAGVMAKSPLSKWPKTPIEHPGEDRGGDPSPRPGMREIERAALPLNPSHQQHSLSIQVTSSTPSQPKSPAALPLNPSHQQHSLST